MHTWTQMPDRQTNRHTGTLAHRQTCTHIPTRVTQTAYQPYIHTYMHARMHAHTRTHGTDRPPTRHTYMHACMHAHTHACTYIHMHAHIYIYIHTYIHTKKTYGRTDWQTYTPFLVLTSYFGVVTRYREVWTDREIDRQTDRQVGRQACTDRQT